MSQDSEAKARANIEFIKDHLNHYNDEDYYRIKELLTNRSDDDFSNAKEVEALVNKRFKNSQGGEKFEHSLSRADIEDMVAFLKAHIEELQGKDRRRILNWEYRLSTRDPAFSISDVYYIQWLVKHFLDMGETDGKKFDDDSDTAVEEESPEEDEARPARVMTESQHRRARQRGTDHMQRYSGARAPQRSRTYRSNSHIIPAGTNAESRSCWPGFRFGSRKKDGLRHLEEEKINLADPTHHHPQPPSEKHVELDNTLKKRQHKAIRTFHQWREQPCWHQFAWIIYVIPMTLFFLSLALVMYLPWTFFKFLRPHVHLKFSDNKRRREEWDKEKDLWTKNEKHLGARDISAPIGSDPEAKEMKHKIWRGFLLKRTWLMYCVLRDCYQSLHRQALQIVGVLCAMIMIIMQGDMIRHDVNLDWVKGMINGYLGGDADPGGALSSQTCAYGLGSGIAKWSGSIENLGWYVWYHSFVILLCVMLIVEETLNIRFGTFAPQTNRAGMGHTTIFLASCMVTASATWGPKGTQQLRYGIVWIIWLVGFYNLTIVLVMTTLQAENQTQELYRQGRHPIRPWNRADWKMLLRVSDFATKVQMSTERFADFAKQKRYARVVNLREGYQPYWTQQWQLWIGDRAWPLSEKERKWNRTTETIVGPKNGDEATEKQLSDKGRQLDYYGDRRHYSHDQLEQERQKGMVLRTIPHGFPISVPPYSKKDIRDRPRYPAAPYNKKPEFGLPDWKPKIVLGELKTKHNNSVARRRINLYYYLDVRRFAIVILSMLLFIVQIALLMQDLPYNSTVRAAYSAEYVKTKQVWLKNGEPTDDSCPYYAGSNLAIYYTEFTALLGPYVNLAWRIVWTYYILTMCIGMWLVAITNNRIAGMHLPFGSTLIGPRLSSICLGWTVLFVSLATLQTGLFPQQRVLTSIARGICYVGVGAWIVFLVPNEPMLPFDMRDPFSLHCNLGPYLSHLLLNYYDGKKFHGQEDIGREHVLKTGENVHADSGQ